jgi:TolB protein
VFTVRPDGRGGRRVGGVGCGLDPAWRPDGRALACAGVVRRGGKPRLGLNIVRPNGRIVRSLPTGGAAGSPTWSPDGERLTYLRVRGARPALYVIGADGRGNRLLSARPSAFTPVYPVAWSPDAARIAFGTGVLPG